MTQVVCHCVIGQFSGIKLYQLGHSSENWSLLLKSLNILIFFIADKISASEIMCEKVVA